MLTGDVKLTVRGTLKQIRGFASLRRTFKAELYKYARLVPRVSDDDYEDITKPEGEAADDLPPSDEEILKQTA